jgi:hypothetical protein
VPSKAKISFLRLFFEIRPKTDFFSFILIRTEAAISIKVLRTATWGRCYDFFNFAEKSGEKSGVLDSKQS